MTRKVGGGVEEPPASQVEVAPVVEKLEVGLTETQKAEVEQIAKEAAEKAAEKAAKEAFNKTTTAAMQNTGANINAAAVAATTAVNDSVRGKSKDRFDAMVDNATVDGVEITKEQTDFFKDLTPSQKGRLTSGNTEVLWNQLIKANTHNGKLRPLTIADAIEKFKPSDGLEQITNINNKGSLGLKSADRWVTGELDKLEGAIVIAGQPKGGLFTTGPVAPGGITEMFLPAEDAGRTGDANGYLLGYKNLQEGLSELGKKLQWANFKVEGDKYEISSGSVGFFGGKKTRKTRKSKKSRKSRKSKKSRKSRR